MMLNGDMTAGWWYNVADLCYKRKTIIRSTAKTAAVTATPWQARGEGSRRSPSKTSPCQRPAPPPTRTRRPRRRSAHIPADSNTNSTQSTRHPSTPGSVRCIAWPSLSGSACRRYIRMAAPPEWHPPPSESGPCGAALMRVVGFGQRRQRRVPTRRGRRLERARWNNSPCWIGEGWIPELCHEEVLGEDLTFMLTCHNWSHRYIRMTPVGYPKASTSFRVKQ